MYICAPRQRTFVITSSITMKSQAYSSKALANNSKILPLNYTKIDRFEKYIYNDTKKFKMLNMVVYFKYLVLRSLRNPCSFSFFVCRIFLPYVSFVTLLYFSW